MTYMWCTGSFSISHWISLLCHYYRLCWVIIRHRTDEVLQWIHVRFVCKIYLYRLGIYVHVCVRIYCTRECPSQWLSWYKYSSSVEVSTLLEIKLSLHSFQLFRIRSIFHRATAGWRTKRASPSRSYSYTSSLSSHTKSKLCIIMCTLLHKLFSIKLYAWIYYALSFVEHLNIIHLCRECDEYALVRVFSFPRTQMPNQVWWCVCDKFQE